MEALVRWPHERLGLIPPLDFIPLAEEAGLMQSLTALVLERAVAQCAAWRAAGRVLSVSVNVSATNLLDSGFSQSVMDLLARYDIEPTSLILEITETTIISDFELARTSSPSFEPLESVSRSMTSAQASPRLRTSEASPPAS